MSAEANEPVVELGDQGSAPLPLGAIVGDRYELRRVLGHGAAAFVYAAEHVRVRRWVALKVPLIAADVRELLCARLRRETDALARVRHPAIVDVVDAGESAGLPFLAMELLEGRTLSGLIAARGRLEVDETLKVGVHLAEGLVAVHTAGLVHRDVKPSNVLVTHAPVNQIHLCDFGIAKSNASAEGFAAKLTHSGAIIGTPEYMPLEALTSSDEADHRVDIYALGITLFECLTGGVPVEGTLAQILVRLSTAELPLVSESNSAVPAKLSAVIARCLSQSPARRFATMHEALIALRACVQRPSEGLDLLRADAEPPATAAAAAAPAAVRTSGEARRGHVRAPYVTVATLQRDGGSTTSARLEDLSEGGVLLISQEAYTAGEVVRLRFGLPISGRVLAVRATVRWTRRARTGPATGLEFIDLPSAPCEEIRKYVALMADKKSR